MSNLTVIPGGAYLDKGADRVWIGGPNGLLARPRMDGTCEFRHASEIPELVLLYTRGDEVDDSGWYTENPRQPEIHRKDIEIIHREVFDV